MSNGIYDIGDTVRCSATFVDTTGANADPTAVLFKTDDPVATTTTYTYGVDASLIKDAVGKYHIDLSPTVAGTWTYRFEGTGTVAAAMENTFCVNTSKFY